MPLGDPQVGETWETTGIEGHSLLGIISDVDLLRIVFVSLTGHRTNVPSSRLGTTWHFQSAAPSLSIPCSRYGCPNGGMLRIQRGPHPDWVCPRHIPLGIVAVVNSEVEAIRAPALMYILPCPECNNQDPVEDHRSGRLDRGEAGWWACTLCSCRWGVIAPPEVGQDAGRWYASALLHLMTGSSRIEMSRVAWDSFDENLRRYFDNLEETPTGLTATFYGVAVYVRDTLDSGVILLHAPRVSRSGTPLRRTDATPSASSLLARAVRAMQEARDEKAHPRAGQWYVHRTSMQFAEIVEIVEDDTGYAVRFRHATMTGLPNASVCLVADTFHSEYMPHSAGAPDPKPIPIESVSLKEGEEWFCVLHDDYVDITEVDAVRGTAHTVGKRTGRARTFTLADFQRPDQFRKVVKRTAYERILDDD